MWLQVHWRSVLALCLAQCLCASCTFVNSIRQVFKTEEAINLYNQSVDEINNKRFREALPALERAVQLDPKSALVQNGLGVTLLGLHRPQEALRHFNAARKLEPDNSNTIMNTGYAYEELGQFSKAIHEFDILIKAGDKYSKYLTERIKVLKVQQADLDRLMRQPGGTSLEDYFVFATYDSGIIRWHARSIPVSVYIDKPKDIKGHRPHFDQLVMRAMKDWENASGGKIKFKSVTLPAHANIRVHFVDNPVELANSIKAGETLTKGGADGLVSAKIRILTLDRRTHQPEPDQDIHATALHEFGHALGIYGHSPYFEDIMFFSSRDSEDMRVLSPRDIQTLHMLYATPKAYIPPAKRRSTKHARH